ncbi:MAG: hypothetical protein LBV68_03085 [Spirochaetaceae bacterium]|nr:hypothetical protein [Spirochaetaceae bacterium]
MSEQILREACVETQAEIDAAAFAGADRIELCSRLDIGGLTPPLEMAEYALSKKLNVAVMIREAEGFSVSDGIARLKAQMNAFCDTGIDAFVFGFLTLPKPCALSEENAALNVSGEYKKTSGSTQSVKIDIDAVSELCAAAGGRETVFHMAFDELAQDAHFDAIDTLVRLGFTRVLTKGGHGKAEDNIAQLKRLNDYAASKPGFSILCGGGVTDGNYLTIAAKTGIRQFHGRRLAIGT